MRDTDIAVRLRNAGLTVVEVDGWRERGSSTFDPKGVVCHHTAGGPSGNAPSLAVCIHGRSDLPGPLCHVLIGRDNTCYVIAAGRANHAGRGGWRGLSGNSSVYGIEHENVGTAREPWREDQLVTHARVAAALIRGRGPADNVCEHKEWAPTRKTDRHSISGADTRARVARFLTRDPAPPPLPTFPVHDIAEDAMRSYFMLIRLDGRGRGWGAWQPGFQPVAFGATRQGPNPAGFGVKGVNTYPGDGYWYQGAEGPAGEVRAASDPIPSVQEADGHVVVSIEGGKPNGVCGVHLWAAPAA